ncbi:MAG: hypothetical protein ABI175_06270 [Polyangiales bacterium]
MTDEENKKPAETRDDAWLDDPDAPPSAEELAESERLRQELEDPGSTHRDVLLARELRLVVAPKPLEAATHRRILARVLGEPASAQRRTTLWITGGALAAAAGVLFVMTTVGQERSAPAPADDLGASLAHVRSADDLFTQPFPREQLTSQRIDIIAEARGRDLRANRYAKWGVK